MADTNAEASAALNAKQRPWAGIAAGPCSSRSSSASGTREELIGDFTNPERGIVPPREQQYAQRICDIAQRDFPVALQTIPVYVVHVKGIEFLANVRLRRCPSTRWMMVDEALAKHGAEMEFLRSCIVVEIGYRCRDYAAVTTCNTQMGPPTVWLHTANEREVERPVRRFLAHELTDTAESSSMREGNSSPHSQNVSWTKPSTTRCSHTTKRTTRG